MVTSWPDWFILPFYTRHLSRRNEEGVDGKDDLRLRQRMLLQE